MPPLIACVVGTRPDFMKMAPVVLELSRRGHAPSLIHTGQHYDERMSQVFFDELGLPGPDVYLGVGTGPRERRAEAISTALAALWGERRPALVVVAGGGESAAVAATVADDMGIAVAHVEAGVRSHDDKPAEQHRLAVDRHTTLFFTSEPAADANLRAEGVLVDRIHRVGSCLIDSLLRHKDRAIAAEPWMAWNLMPRSYALVTLHHPENVDDEARLAALMAMLGEVATLIKLLFPVHPRTRAKLGAHAPPGVILAEPQPYLAFTGLTAKAALVITDSHGVQEETTALGVPCVTLAERTEHPLTVEQGTNVLAGSDPVAATRVIVGLLSEPARRARVPALWDGKAAVRVVDEIERWLRARPSAA